MPLGGATRGSVGSRFQRPREEGGTTGPGCQEGLHTEPEEVPTEVEEAYIDYPIVSPVGP